ncbi:MAG: HAD-IA family hydrolase [Bryobacteraceae bacterium]
MSGRPLDPGLALIFDMDGVVVDSNPLHRIAWAEYNRRRGLATTEEMQQSMYGKRNDRIVRDFFGEDLTDAEVSRRGKEKEALFRELASGRVRGMLVPGIREFLERYRNVPKALATNADQENTDFILAESGLRPYFSAVVDGSKVSKPKPDPEIYLLAATQLGAISRNCIVFEDSQSGLNAALAAKMRVVGILTTHANLPNAAVCVDNFLDNELLRWMEDQSAVA